ncbi:hypothetical protein [Taibaiella koreensis]|uniref:hypothetical protein n=1 Tax=Taibaiella koreensis TaxID=1268548 RepID=UPI000E59AD75|nr:hypothetical protein [Taibaiella koreensis]
MQKLATLSLLFIFIFAIPVCGQHPELGKKIIDLKTFSVKFNVYEFYKNQIETHQKSLALYSQRKTKEAFSEELLKDYKFLENIDTLFVDNNIYLLLYEMKGMNTKDTLATFEGIRFQKLDMAANDKNEFQSLRATSETYKDDKKNFYALKHKLENVYGKPQIIEETLQHGEYYEWVTDDFIINLTLGKDEGENGVMSFPAKLYLTKKSEYENLKANFIGKSKYYWIY